jgi:hypothetical protein
MSGDDDLGAVTGVVRPPVVSPVRAAGNSCGAFFILLEFRLYAKDVYVHKVFQLNLADPP